LGGRLRLKEDYKFKPWLDCIAVRPYLKKIIK
jgi:hypothetical protein